MFKNHSFIQGFALAALAMLAAGCGPGRTIFKVMPSNLNFAHITHAVDTNNVVVMAFYGTGYCVLTQGGDPGFVNPFSLQPHATREIRRELSSGEVNAVFQALVFEGVFDTEPKETRAPALPYTSMVGRIQNKAFSRVSRTPGFLEIAALMRALFEAPEQHRELFQ